MSLCSWTGTTGPRGEVRVKRTTMSWRAGLAASSLRTQERRESLEEVPVAQTARMVPSSCSCTVGSLATVPPGAASPSIQRARFPSESSSRAGGGAAGRGGPRKMKYETWGEVRGRGAHLTVPEPEPEGALHVESGALGQALQQDRLVPALA